MYLFSDETLKIMGKSILNPTEVPVNKSYTCKLEFALQNVSGSYSSKPYPFAINVNISDLRLQAFNLAHTPTDKTFMTGRSPERH